MNLKNTKRIVYALVEDTSGSIVTSSEHKILNDCLNKLNKL